MKVCRGLGCVALAAVATISLAACSSSDGGQAADLATSRDLAAPDLVAVRDAAPADLVTGDQGRDLVVDQSVPDWATGDTATGDTATGDTAFGDTAIGADLAVAADLGAADQFADITPALVPNFSLTDVNTTSASYNTKVSPRDYIGKVAAFFFTTAT
jgi:hypothetical protein